MDEKIDNELQCKYKKNLKFALNDFNQFILKLKSDYNFTDKEIKRLISIAQSIDKFTDSAFNNWISEVKEQKIVSLENMKD